VALDVPYAFTFEMDVTMNGVIRGVQSPSHPIEVEQDGTRARVRLAQQVLVLTDGEVTNTDEVIELARRHASTARFFTFGIGAGASQHLVRAGARASGGAAEFISPGERIEAKVMRQFTRVFAPALTDVTVEWGQPGATPAADERVA
jgi:hypothetical protein